MRRLLGACVILALAGCQNVAGPDTDPPGIEDSPTISAAASPNACRGQIIAGIANTWPWAHDDKSSFAPSPGAIALWVELFGPDLGISSVHELQELFCSP